MKLEYLKEFISLAELNNFTEAARANYISQPVFSRHMKSLENELGVKLILRDTHNVVLTDCGCKLYEMADKIVAVMDQTIREISLISKGVTGTLRLGILYYSYKEDFMPIVNKFMKINPNVNIEHNPGQPIDILNGLNDATLDIGVLPKANYPQSRFIKYVPISKEPLILYCGKKHKLSKKRKVTLKDIKEEKIITLQNDKCMTIATEEALRRCDFTPKTVIYSSRLDTVPYSINHQNAVFLFPRDGDIPALNELVKIPIKQENLYFEKAYAFSSQSGNHTIPMFFETYFNINED